MAKTGVERCGSLAQIPSPGDQYVTRIPDCKASPSVVGGWRRFCISFSFRRAKESCLSVPWLYVGNLGYACIHSSGCHERRLITYIPLSVLYHLPLRKSTPSLPLCKYLGIQLEPGADCLPNVALGRRARPLQMARARCVSINPLTRNDCTMWTIHCVHVLTSIASTLCETLQSICIPNVEIIIVEYPTDVAVINTKPTYNCTSTTLLG